MDAMGVVRRVRQTGLGLDLKWLLAVLSSTLIWGDVVMCYLVICGLISGFGVRRAQGLAQFLGLSFNFLHCSSLFVYWLNTCTHIHSPTLKLY